MLVRPGDKVTVTPTTGAPFSGRIASLSGSRLTLRVGKELRELQELDVATVRHRRPDSLKNGAAWGLGIGAAAGMLTCGRCHVGPGLMVAGIYGGIGAGIGVGIDALIEGRLVVYQRRDSTRRVTVTPQLARSHKGVNVSISFKASGFRLYFRASWTISTPLAMAWTCRRPHVDAVDDDDWPVLARLYPFLELNYSGHRTATRHQRGVAGLQELAHADRGLFLEPLLIVAVDDVAVRINEPRHHRHAARIDPLPRRARGGGGSGRDNLPVAHHDGAVWDHRTVADDDAGVGDDEILRVSRADGQQQTDQ